MKRLLCIATVLVAGCAGGSVLGFMEQDALLTSGTERAGAGTGRVVYVNRGFGQMTVDLGGQRYAGPLILRNEPTADFKPIEASAMLRTDNARADELRCDVVLDALMKEGQGQCRDQRGALYDLRLRSSGG